MYTQHSIYCSSTLAAAKPQCGCLRRAQEGGYFLVTTQKPARSSHAETHAQIHTEAQPDAHA